MNTDIILVNEQDMIVGYGEKMYVHRCKLLHRAFSIFIFDWSTQKMLLQKRAYGKYHSGGLWTNACCSHPRKDESMVECLQTRLSEELGLSLDLYIDNSQSMDHTVFEKDIIFFCGKFSYFASYGELCENEIDYVYLYSPEGGFEKSEGISINTQEVAEIKWISIDEIKTWIEKEPGAFTAWFRPAFMLAYEMLCEQARNSGNRLFPAK